MPPSRSMPGLATGEVAARARSRGPSTAFALALACVAVLSAGCDRDDGAVAPGPAPGPVPQAPAGGGSAQEAGQDLPLEDVVERDAGYIIGISYPAVANEHPGLARRLKAYADDARAALEAAVADRPADAVGPFDLSLAFTETAVSPSVVAVAVDGSSYLGGAHGIPLVERFVWLPGEGRLLEASDLVDAPAGWEAVSEHVREQLHTRLSQEADEAELVGEARGEFMRTRAAMIEKGTRPLADDFSTFEPVLSGDGRIEALRFVFPPGRVAPYEAGTQSVEVPAGLLLSHVADAHRGLFAGG